MIAVDTSVWIDWLRGGDPAVRALLDGLLDDDRVALAVPVRVELLGGVRRDQAGRLAHLLAALPTWTDTETTWTRVEAWALAAAGKGQHFGVGDLLVAGIASDHAADVWSLDADFARMEALGFVRCFPG